MAGVRERCRWRRRFSGTWRTRLTLVVSAGRRRGHGRALLRFLEHSPVIDVVILVALASIDVAEQLAEVGIVGLVIKPQRPHIVEVCCKFLGVTLLAYQPLQHIQHPSLAKADQDANRMPRKNCKMQTRVRV